jgi:hypothetical protein
VFVDGRGPYSFVLDTGAGSTVVSNELADALALPRGENQDGRGAAGKMTLVKSQLPSLTVGQETVEGFVAKFRSGRGDANGVVCGDRG